MVVSGTLGSKPRLQYVRNLKIVSTFLRDASGQLEVTWFNMPFIMKTSSYGNQIYYAGACDQTKTADTACSSRSFFFGGGVS